MLFTILLLKRKLFRNSILLYLNGKKGNKTENLSGLIEGEKV